MTRIETPPRWTVLLWLLSRVSWTFPAGGQSHLIGSPQPITASPGDDVILPCHLEPRLDARWLTLEWTRTDLKPESDRLRRGAYVYLRRGGMELRDAKISSYADRAALLAEKLIHGIVSLRINNVTTADEGTYQCFVPSLKSHVIVQLVVDSKSVETWTTSTMTTHPTRDVQTPDPTNSNGRQKLLVVWILLVVGIVLLLATTVVFIQRKRRQHVEVRNKETDDAASCFLVPETPRGDQSKTFAV